MSVVYDGSHSVIFYDALASDTSSTPTYYKSRKHSWTDFHLVPTKRLSIVTPSPSIAMIPIPGSNRNVDMTDLMPGGLRFGRRQGEWEFIVDQDKWDNWSIAKKTLEDYLHGKRLYCVLEDDYNTAYVGRFKIANWESGSDYSSISIAYDLEYGTYFNVFNTVRDISDRKSIYTWIEIDGMIRDGSYKTSLQIGDRCALTLPGEYEDYVEIAGIDVDQDSDGNILPITWVGRAVLSKKRQMQSSGTLANYLQSDLRTYLNDGDKGLASLFPDRLKHMLRKAKKTTYRYSSSSSSGATATHSDYIWIPSYREVTGNTTAKETSGPIYSEYFNSPASLSRMPTHYDSQRYYEYGSWFLRTSWNESYYMTVHTTPTSGTTSHVYTNYRIQPTGSETVLPCFCTDVAT